MIGELVLQRLDEQVADHSLALCAEHVEGIRQNALVRIGFECEQADLRAVAVRDHELMTRRDSGEGRGGLEDIAPLGRRLRRLAAA